jgi:hypothetical protein
MNINKRYQGPGLGQAQNVVGLNCEIPTNPPLLITGSPMAIQTFYINKR